MSYDLEVVTHRKPVLDDVKAVVSGRTQIEGEMEGEGQNLVVHTSRWQFTVDGPFTTEPEDLEPVLCTAVVAPRWMLQISVPAGSPKAAASLASRIATAVARSCSGAVYDPQQDRVLFPRSGKRPIPAQPKTAPEREIDFQWVYSSPALAVAGSQFLAAVRAYLPEALPQRYGTFEPLQHRLETGDEAFLRLWSEEARSSGQLFWTGSRRRFDGNASWPFANEANARLGGLAAAQLCVTMPADPFLDDERWRKTIQGFFCKTSNTTGALYGRAVVTAPKPLTILAKDIDKFGQPSPAIRSRWYGIPRFPAWLTWLGRPYADGQPETEGDRTMENGRLLIAEENLEARSNLVHAAIPDSWYRRQYGAKGAGAKEKLAPDMRFTAADWLPSSLGVSSR